LAPDELFELSDADMEQRGLIVHVEEHVHAFARSSLPVVEELRFDVVLAAKFRLAGGAGEKLCSVSRQMAHRLK
jgi:hypothetical protein